MDITRHPPCTPKCPSRGMGCHSGCEAYAAWKKQMEEISCERRKQIEAAQGVSDLEKERKEWLRRKGWKIKGGVK